MSSPRLSKSQWSALIQRFEASDMTQAGFAQEHQLSISTFRAYLYRSRQSQKQEPRFIEVHSPSSAVTAGSQHEVCIEIAGHLRVNFRSSPSSTDLAALLLQLAEHLPC